VVHIIPSFIGVAVVVLVSVNLAAVIRAHLRQRRVRAVLEPPSRIRVGDRKVQLERAIEVFAETGGRLRRRAPHLSEAERHELACALMRAKGILPPGPPVLTRTVMTPSPTVGAR
jgi:hypothetical protein